MAQKRKPDQTKLIADAALALAGKHGWDRLSMKDVAKKAKVKQAVAEKQFSDGWDILQWVLKRLEKDTDDAVKGHLGDSWRDNLMEILMLRFELAQQHRDAYAAIGPSVLREPPVVRRFAKDFCKTLERMLDTSGVPRKKLQPLIVAGFGAVYLSLVDTWLKDKTPDLSKTMAAIDQRLGLLEQACDFLEKGPRLAAA